MSDAAPLICRFRLQYPGAERAALHVDLSLPERGITVIFGPSGAGKTSLLRCIAGLEQAVGELRVAGDCWQGGGINLPTHRRPLGYVFQEASLFPHLTVRGNLRYAWRRAQAGQVHWDQVIALMDLGGLLDRHPAQLSGGERQRVAIGRALLIRPRLLLMDEPLAGLDAARKQDILPYLERLHTDLKLPILYVTHSLDELLRLADHLVVLAQGRVQVQGPAASVLPQLPLPAGEEAGAIIDATVTERDAHWRLARLNFPGGELWVPDSGAPLGQAMRLRVLARDVSLSRDEAARSSILNRVPARIEGIDETAGTAQAEVRLQMGDTPLLARVTRRSVAALGLRAGDCVWAQIKSVAVLR